MKTIKYTGLQCLMLLRFHQIAGVLARIARRRAGQLFGVAEMLASAKDMKLKACTVSETCAELAPLPSPAIVLRRNDRFVIGGKIGAHDILAQDP